MSVTLRPITAGGETLRSGCKQRPQIVVSSFDDSQPMYLGRNSTTQIADSVVSRREAKIGLVAPGFLWIEAVKTKIWINDKVIHAGASQSLRHGDVIHLPPAKQYAYVVEYSNGEPEPSVQASPETPNRGCKRSASSRTASVSLPESVREELFCSICLDLQVRSILLVPCGHHFCQGCIKTGTTSCPNCRAPITTKVPCRAIDNIIHGFAALGESTTNDSALAKDDLDEYKKRYDQAKTPRSSHKKTKYRNRIVGNSRTDAIFIE